MNKHVTLFSAFLTVIGTVMAAGGDGDILKSKVETQTSTVQQSPQALHIAYRPTFKPATWRPLQAAANGLTADFSIQGGTSQVEVWSENFDTDLSQWTINNEVNSGWGPVTVELASSSNKREAFSVYDENDVTSLHIDGDYRVSKRNTAYVTSGSIQVPANAQFHAYVGYTEWEECGLYISVSTDDFETQTELWNSKNSTISNWAWHKIDADLSAFAGQTIKVRFTYGEGTKSNYGIGGYLGDFYVDGVSITGVTSVESITVTTGEEINFVDLSAGTPTSWQWSFPGATPATSTEQNPTVIYEHPGTYDVTLTVTDAEGSDVVTKTSFVTVEGVGPVAGVEWPCDFRDLTTRLRMVAPFAPVTYRDASTGFPTTFSWTFLSEYDNTGGIITPTVYTDKDQTYQHEKLNKYFVTHIAQNETGYDYVDDQVQVQFEGMVTNFQPEDGYQTNFVDGDLTLPGANKMGITAWAEKISKPAAPVVMNALYVNFTKASAEELTDQIASVSFYLYTSNNGMPGEPIDLLDSWTLSELNYAMTTNNGIVTIELSHPYVLEEEVFIVIDGIPEKNDNLECAIAMAPMRSFGNTAFMCRNGVWRPFTGYFQAAPGGQTSLAVFPVFTYSVLVPANVDDENRVTLADDLLEVGAQAGTAEKTVFANRGVRYVGSNAAWCRLTGEPGDETVDVLHIEYDALPEGVTSREAIITVTDADAVSTLNIHVVQSGTATGIKEMRNENGEMGDAVFTLDGRRVLESQMSKGIYIKDGRKVVIK